MNVAPNPSATDNRVVLISCYELGHEPLGLGVPAGVLRRAGLPVRLIDLSVEDLDEDIIATALFIGISVPMHTALRIGVAAAQRVRSINPAAHICVYGMYAELNTDALAEVADSVLGAEFEAPLAALAARVLGEGELRQSKAAAPGKRSPNRGLTLVPDRSGLANADRYVKLSHNGALHRVGYTATSRGCKHLCRHCPLPPVYNGSFYAIPTQDVLADIESLVSRGARHITFGDPDFLNGPTHARRIARAMNERFPGITFDYTAKVEHLLRHRSLVEELQGYGNLFVVTAVESLNDRVLTRLHKGHTPSDIFSVFRQFAQIGLTLRPTFVPFTPWETRESFANLLSVIDGEGLVENVDPVQYSIRLLVPPGSLLLEGDDMTPFLGALDTERFSWQWRHPDPAMDTLQGEVEHIVRDGVSSAEETAVTFGRIRSAAGHRTPTATPMDSPPRIRGHAGGGTPPRLTEAWFC